MLRAHPTDCAVYSYRTSKYTKVSTFLIKQHHKYSRNRTNYRGNLKLHIHFYIQIGRFFLTPHIKYLLHTCRISCDSHYKCVHLYLSLTEQYIHACNLQMEGNILMINVILFPCNFHNPTQIHCTVTLV